MKQKILKNNFGIFQGRLTDSNKLQKYPDFWENELITANKLGYSYVEFFLEEKVNNKNPFWSKKGRNKINFKIKKVFETSNFILCDNYIIKNNLYKNKTKIYLEKVLDNLKNFKKPKLILPINSNYFEDINCLSNFFNKILKKKDQKIEISFEVDANYKKIVNFLNRLNIKNIGLTFDSGNIFLHHNSIIKYFYKLKSYINHVHIKDRDIKGRNVKLGSGMVNFKKFLKILIDSRYKREITLETYRKKNSIIEANNNLNYLNKLL
jgi:sugar phosphate isomerase/epimerase